MQIYNEAGFDELEEILKDYADKADPGEMSKILEKGADDFVSDLKSLPKPRSQIMSPRHAHMLDTMAKKTEDGKVSIGWGAYYGPILEHGSKKMSAHAHLRPTWERNKERYYQTMINQFNDGGI